MKAWWAEWRTGVLLAALIIALMFVVAYAEAWVKQRCHQRGGIIYKYQCVEVKDGAIRPLDVDDD